MTETTSQAHPKGHDAFLSAADLKAIMAKKDQHKEAEKKKKREQEEAAKKALIEEFKKPVEITEEKVEEAIRKFRGAAENGQTEMVVFSFPSEVCKDHGRAINSALEGWQDTLVGKARSIYEAWERYLKDKGYQLHARVLSFPHGMLGDIGLVVIWAKKET